MLLCVSSLEDWESIRLKNQGSDEKCYNMSQLWYKSTTGEGSNSKIAYYSCVKGFKILSFFEGFLYHFYIHRVPEKRATKLMVHVNIMKS